MQMLAVLLMCAQLSQMTERKDFQNYTIYTQLFTQTVEHMEEGYTRYSEQRLLEQIELENNMADLEMITQLVHAEAGNQDIWGKRMVADVVMNRVRDPRFPDTVEEVIFQENQFTVTHNGSYEKAAYELLDSDFEAVWLEYECGFSSDTEILYFSSNGCVKGTTYMYQYGDHYFSK